LVVRNSLVSIPTLPVRPIKEAAMIRSTLPRRLPAPYTLFARLLALPDQIAALFRTRRTDKESAKLHVETMEERVVPDGRPLPGPVIFAGAGVEKTPIVKAYDADTGDLRWSSQVYDSSFDGGVRVAAADFTGDGVPDVVVAPGAGHDPHQNLRWHDW
jgi:hypothetical protein